MSPKPLIVLSLAMNVFAQTEAAPRGIWSKITRHRRKPAPSPRAARSVVLNWTASTTAGVDYFAYRATGTCAAAANFAKINTTTITGVTYTDANVADGTYCYYVTAHHPTAIPNESVASNKAEVVVQSQPAPPTNLTVSPAAVTLMLNDKQQFTASRGTQPVAAAWSIDPADTGTISATGLYTAPAAIKGNNVGVQVLARESGDLASATVTLRKN